MAGKIKIPKGEKITIDHGKLRVPDNPIIAFIEGDGTGPDIWQASVRVLDAAVEQAYHGKKKIAWTEVYAGEKAHAVYGSKVVTYDFARMMDGAKEVKCSEFGIEIVKTMARL